MTTYFTSPYTGEQINIQILHDWNWKKGGRQSKNSTGKRGKDKHPRRMNPNSFGACWKKMRGERGTDKQPRVMNPRSLANLKLNHKPKKCVSVCV